MKRCCRYDGPRIGLIFSCVAFFLDHGMLCCLKDNAIIQTIFLGFHFLCTFFRISISGFKIGAL